jgi:hypothetical protein
MFDSCGIPTEPIQLLNEGVAKTHRVAEIPFIDVERIKNLSYRQQNYLDNHGAIEQLPPSCLKHHNLLKGREKPLIGKTAIPGQEPPTPLFSGQNFHRFQQSPT